VDVLVEFSSDATWSLFDLVTMQNELAAIFGRKVDLVEFSAVRNPFRRREIERTRQVLFAA
jgi:predicted nucleotidyltransferase